MEKGSAFVLGMFGGVLGLFGASSVFFIVGSQQIFEFGWLSVLAGIIGLAGAGMIKNSKKISGVLMLSSAFMGTFSIGSFYILGAMLSGMAGLSVLVCRDSAAKKNK